MTKPRVKTGFQPPEEKGATFKAEKPPTVIMDKEPEEAKAAIDLCQCSSGLPRWYAGDSRAKHEGDTLYYRCRACGKWYQ